MLGLSHRAHANAQQQNCVHARSICARVCVCTSVVPCVLVCVCLSVCVYVHAAPCLCALCSVSRCIYVYCALHVCVSLCGKLTGASSARGS